MTNSAETTDCFCGQESSLDALVEKTDVSLTQTLPESLSILQKLRESILTGVALCFCLIAPFLRKWKRFRWAIALRADARLVGVGVHLYGPVRFLGTRNVSIGGWGNLYDGVLFETVDAGRIRIGDHFRINRGTLISAHEAITIGDHVLIGEYVSIRDNGHRLDDSNRPIGEQGFDTSPVRIGDDVWIGRGAVVLKGVAIGNGAVIAANAVVTKNVPPMEVWAGVPARFLRGRCASETA